MSASTEKPIKSKKPWLAGILNIIIPGLGHIYLKNRQRGIVTFCLIISLLIGLLILQTFQDGRALVYFVTNILNIKPILILAILIGALFWDGYSAGKKYNNLQSLSSAIELKRR